MVVSREVFSGFCGFCGEESEGVGFGSDSLSYFHVFFVRSANFSGVANMISINFNGSLTF
jgi:hypothetical protein